MTQLDEKPTVILTIDDEKAIRESFRNYLEDFDYDVLEAENGRKGLETIEREHPDLVLVDLRMPEVDGLEVLETVTKKWSDMPIIIVSGTGVIGDAVEAIRLGAWDYLLKPVEDLSVLLHSVEKALERGRLIVENRQYQEHLEEQVAQRTQQLKKINDELEKRVEERTRELLKTNKELKKAKEAADAAAKAKSDFLANMSHEIRTPMNGVIAAADLAMSEKLPPKVEHLLKTIHTSGYTLLGIINDILDFSKIEAGKLDLEARPFRLDEALDNVVMPFVKKVTEKGIELLMDVVPGTPLSLKGDQLRIQQILTNLVANAVKFTEKSGIILVGVSLANTPMDADGVKLKFFVKDSGVGMTLEEQNRLFQPFTQADTSTTRKFGGTGLGLSICKQLVEMMAGEIWLESEAGVGSTFYFTLLLQRQPSEEEDTLKAPNDLRDINALVVDDCAESRQLIEKMLQVFDINSTLAESGVDAIELLKESADLKKEFDLAIVDWKMPQMDGIETIRKIREELHQTVPIILMSAFGREPDLNSSEKSRLNGFLNKPFHASSLFDAIMDIFGKERSTHVQKKKDITTHVSIFKKRVRGMRVLVAEDNPTNQEIAVAVLESANVDVKIAGNGIEAVDAVKKEPFDAVLMDIQMPKMDGYEATRLIREWQEGNRDEAHENKTLPIIAMTAHAMKGDEEKCLQAGMDGYISKPIDQERLFYTLCKKVSFSPGEEPPPETESPGVGEEMEAEVEEEIPTALPGIAIQDTLNMLKVDQSFYKRLVAGFFKNNADFMGRMEAAFTDDNWKDVELLAHTIKGAGASIGANLLRDVAQELETAAMEAAGAPGGEAPGGESPGREAPGRESPGRESQGGETPDHDMLARLEIALNQVFESIKSLIDIPDNESSLPEKDEEIDLAGLAPLLKDFLTALDSSDPDAIDHCLDAIRSLLGDHPMVRSLATHVENYDYDEAIEVVTEFAGKSDIQL
ncbi:MAG: response regulator, partial [Desulfobacterales bacterium]|nr:response regulator [Desulfobacterales bacterium]